MQFSFNPPLLALSLAGFAIIFSTTAANPVITHKPIPIASSSTITTSSFLPPPTLLPITLGGTSVNATSTTLISTTTNPNPGIPLHPSTIQDQAPTTRPQPNDGGSGNGCEYPSPTDFPPLPESLKESKPPPPFHLIYIFRKSV